ncbi:MAG: porin [Candidatus Thiodiazotropha sp. (ex Semelilucina semeliformis)]|nr:porin [Candidatus Thiodiazotropha sp. (ex Semelilucina semeliformis)]
MSMTVKARPILCLFGALSMLPLSASAFNFKDVIGGDVEFSLGGYAKLSAMWTDTDSGTLAGGAGSTGRTFYLPSSIPTGGTGGDQVFDMTARESRINFKAKTNSGPHSLGVVLEMDFLTTGFGNEIVSNSFSPRLRHYFLTYDNWLFGQTWSTFMDTAALPDALDFLGAPEGTVFIRQPMIRYSRNGFQIALENPETFTDVGLNDDNSVPDLAANYTMKTNWGHLRFNGLLRELKYDDGTQEDSASGWGLGVSGKVKVFDKDDVRFAVNYGDGMGRYTSLGVVRDAVIDPVSGDLDAVESVAGFVAYRHMWNSKWRSNLIYSMVDVDNPASAPGSLNESASSIQVNLMYTPVKQLTLGVMYLQGELEKVNGDEGELDRIQFAAKYSF